MLTCPACNTSNSEGAAHCVRCSAPLNGDGSLSETVPIRGASPPAAAGVVSSSGAAAASSLDLALETKEDGRPDPILGTRLAGRFDVTRKIGQGGMGAVYEARHTLIGKRVALKVLLEKYAERPEVVARLQQEARLASSIGNEHIVDITDFGQTSDGRTFVVMEYLEGESLAQRLAREGPFPPARALGIVRQVADALGAAHLKGVVHRDIKPENIFLVPRSDQDFVKVLDFGISKLVRPADSADGPDSPRLTQTGMVLGTPLYMSPEQARGEDGLDHRIDIYALGVILYELVTGEVPFRGTNYLNVIAQVLSQEPKRPSVIRPDLGISPTLEAVIGKAMARNVGDRYASMAEFSADLGRLITGESVSAPPVLDRPAGTGTRRGRVWAAVIGAVVLGVALLVRNVLGPATAADDPAQGAAAAAPPAPPVVDKAPPEPARPLAADTITVHVTSVPSGAAVWWKDVSKGTTPVDLALPKGDNEMQLTLRLEGYQDAVAPLFPTRDQSLPVQLQKLGKPAPTAASRPPKRPPTPVSVPSPGPDRGPTSGGEIKPTPYGGK